IGQVYEVMIEGRLTEDAPSEGDVFPFGNSFPEGNVYVGRTYMDAPDIDGFIYVRTGQKRYMTGDMMRVLVTGAHGYDLLGEPADV
ncbi:MAG: hypothetical protein IKE56_09105, partial [Lachnospiraceae bacterium]|nr:hypothetical protein [Lachnospiraceae bacterium]